METKPARRRRGRQDPAKKRATRRQPDHTGRQQLCPHRQQQKICRHPSPRRSSRARPQNQPPRAPLPPHQRQRRTPTGRRTPNPRHRHRRPQKRTLTTKNGREKTVRFLFHYLQLFFTFSIPANPPSSHFFPFISSSLYIYLIGFHPTLLPCTGQAAAIWARTGRAGLPLPNCSTAKTPCAAASSCPTWRRPPPRFPRWITKARAFCPTAA